MGSPQGLAKYQSRRISAVGSLSTATPSTGKPATRGFNQVRAPVSVDTSYDDAPGYQTPEHSAQTIPRKTLTQAQSARLDSSILELAGRYVSLFQNHTGNEMADAERSALVTEVAVFYSHPTRKGRLEALVGALDCSPN